MSKKDFKGGLDSLLGGEATREEIKTAPTAPTVAESKVKEIRATFIVDEDLHEKIKAISYFERENIKDTLDKALRAYISKYEKANGVDYLDLYKKNN